MCIYLCTYKSKNSDPINHNPQTKQKQDTPAGQAALADLTGKIEGSKAWLEGVGYSAMAIETFWEVRSFFVV
jgi:hypothetical protein